MEKRKRNHTYVGNRTIFVQLLGLLVALSVLTILLFSVFINQIVVKNQRRNIDELNLHQIQRISADVELVFDLLSQSMTRSMWSEDFINLMITPNQHSADLAVRIVEALKDQVDDNDLVRKAYLYLPGSNEVYVYSGTYMNLEYLGDRDMVSDYLELRQDGRDMDNTSEWRILLYNRRIFLATDFCLPNFVGAMFYEINRQELYDIIQMENESFNTTIYVYDDDNTLLFDYMAGGLQPKDFRDTSLFLTEVDANPDARYYMYTSQLLGWKYLVKIDPSAGSVSWGTLLGILLPCLLVYVLISVLFSLYITRRVYQPINRLIQITSNPDSRRQLRPRGRHYQDEVDFLELAFTDSLEENEQHRELMSNISDGLLEQSLHSLLSGRNPGRETIQQTLTGIGREDLLKGFYMAIAICFQWDENENVTPVEKELYHRSLIQIVENQEFTEGTLRALTMNDQLTSLVLHFPENMSALSIHEAAGQLEKNIEAAVESLPYNISVGHGKIYTELDSLQFSYHEAIEKAQYMSYLAVEDRDAAASDDGNQVRYELRYYLERAKMMYENAIKGELEAARLESVHLIRDIEERVGESEDIYHGLIDDMLENLIACRVSQEEMKQAGVTGSLQEIRSQMKEQRSSDYMIAFYNKTLELLWNSSKRTHNRYVEDAKEYIAAHYGNGSLNLNMVSEAVGISPAYLSNIFAESVGMGLNNYLNEYRVSQAKLYLQETGMNISEIGYKCGFNSSQSFTRVFKKYADMPPKRYREIMAQRNG